jgi:hypothetical protein
MRRQDAKDAKKNCAEKNVRVTVVTRDRNALASFPVVFPLALLAPWRRQGFCPLP